MEFLKLQHKNGVVDMVAREESPTSGIAEQTIEIKFTKGFLCLESQNITTTLYHNNDLAYHRSDVSSTSLEYLSVGLVRA